MFRGFTLREARLLAALIFSVLSGMVLISWLQEDEAAAVPLVEGSVVQHEAGELVSGSAEKPITKTIDLPVSGVLDLNSSTAKDFEALPGIGPAKSAAIVARREELRGFASVDELITVHGIGEKTLERLRPFVSISQPREPVAEVKASATPPEVVAPSEAVPLKQTISTPVRVNIAGMDELQRLSGIGPKLAGKIVEDRKRNGPFQSPEDLQRVNGIGPKTVEKNLHLISCQ